MRIAKLISLAILFLLVLNCSKKKEFDSNEWKNWVETETTLDTRWLMHKDLLRKYKLKGVSRDSILNLLGKPDSEIDNEYRYFLGSTGRGINTGTMTITFENGSVVDIKVTNG